MPTILTDLEVDRVDLVEEGANSVAYIKLFKTKGDSIMTLEEILNSLKPEHKAVVEEALTKAREEAVETAKASFTEQGTQSAETDAKIGDLEKAICDKDEVIKELQEKVAKYEDTEEKSFDEVLKSVDPAVQSVIKQMKKQSEEAIALVNKYKEEEVTNIAKSTAESLKGLPVDQDKLVDVIKKGVSPEVLDILKAASKAVEDSDIFKSKGSNPTQSVGAGSDAWDQIEAKAAVIAKSENISKSKAVARVIKEEPVLYKAYLDGGAN